MPPNPSTPPETKGITQEQLDTYETLRSQAIWADEAFRAYEQKIAAFCDHPKKYVDDWEWEHDNGYGRQHMVTGKYCRICGATKYYESDTYWHKPTT